MTQDRPDAAELLDAVAEFLSTEVSEWVPPREAVPGPGGGEPVRHPGPGAAGRATSRCATTWRCSASCSAPIRPASARRGGASRGGARMREAELARRLRAGELDGELEAVAARLRDHVRRKLEIARPGLRRLSGRARLQRCSRVSERVFSEAPPSIAIVSPVMYAGLLGGQEGDQGGDLGGLGHPAGGHASTATGRRSRRASLHPFGRDHPGEHRVGSDRRGARSRRPGSSPFRSARPSRPSRRPVPAARFAPRRLRSRRPAPSPARASAAGRPARRETRRSG